MNVIFPSVGQMAAMSDAELAAVDPVVMNLAVARGIPSLGDLDIAHYVRIADEWGADLVQKMRVWEEKEFYPAPHNWKNDIGYFRLGIVCWYADLVLGVTYKEDQREAKRILYTDPTDLFLNGVMDTGKGTCGNLATLHVVLGRRAGLPVSLACVGSHYLCRYDDGVVTHNIEATETGRGGFSSQTDDYILNKHRLPRLAQTCGSDLRAVTPHEMLGLFLGLRARHLENTHHLVDAERDYLLARYLFPTNRNLYVAQVQTSVQRSMKLFEPGENGHPTELGRWLQQIVAIAPWTCFVERTSPSKEIQNASRLDDYFSQVTIGG